MCLAMKSTQMTRICHSLCVGLILTGLLPILFATPAYANDDGEALFGASSALLRGTVRNRKWHGMLDRHEKTSRSQKVKCASGVRGRDCRLSRWISYLTGLRDASPVDQIRKVNRKINRYLYVTDIRNWGVLDYWAAPDEFFRRDGDCEDYAIAKYLSLRFLGHDPETLRIVVVRDLNLRANHAVMVVFHHGESLVLDNQTRRLVEAARIRHYQPIYSLNENSWWSYRF